MIKVGIVSVSDTRRHVYEELEEYILVCEKRIEEMLSYSGQVQVVKGETVVNGPRSAVKVGRQMAAQGVCCVIANIAIFSFPSLVMNVLSQSHVPFLAFTVKNPSVPGLVGLMANTGFMRQNGFYCKRVWGEPEDPAIARKVLSFIRAAHASESLKGQVFGLIGGRSIGMGTGAVNPTVWLSTFGVDVDHVDQLEIVDSAPLANDDEVNRGMKWLEQNIGAILYDNVKLTDRSLREQLRYYQALRRIAQEGEYDFLGVKCHCELSARHSPPCLSIAMLNDPYDYDGKKPSICCSCEADADGALSMQVLKMISGMPSFLADTRHLDIESGLFTLCNCGSIPTYYAGASEDPRENLARVTLHPIIPKYTGTGCHVGFIGKEGEMTFARLTYSKDHYRMIIFCGQSVGAPPEILRETEPKWPHFFIRLQCDAGKLVETYESNHVHGVYGDYIQELRDFCDITGVECVLLR